MRKGPAEAGPFQCLGQLRTVMFAACGPFGPCVVSNDTRSPSFSERKPLELIAEKCANTSAEPSSGAMKPKPLSPLNHLTVPVAMMSPHVGSGARAVAAL